MSSNPFVVLTFGQVQVQVQVRPITTEGFREHLAAESARIRRLVAERDQPSPRKAVVVVDGSVALMPPSEARKLQAEWLKEHANLLQLVTHQIAFVLPNPLLRGFVAAVFFLVPLPVPSTTHGSLDEAVAAAIREAQAIGATVDPELLRDGGVAVERARARALFPARPVRTVPPSGRN